MRYTVGSTIWMWGTFRVPGTNDWEDACIECTIREIHLTGCVVDEIIPGRYTESGEDEVREDWINRYDVINEAIYKTAEENEPKDQKFDDYYDEKFAEFETEWIKAYNDDPIDSEDEEDDYVEEEDYEEKDSDTEEDERVEGYSGNEEDKREVLSWHSVRSLMLTGEDEYNDDS